jgi:hypothetical protein
MSVDDGPDPSADPVSAASTRRGRLSAGALLRGATRRVRSSPTLALPFLVVGLLLAGVDYVRLRDPVPVRVTEYTLASGLDVQSPLYPSAVSRTTTSLDALVGLKPQYLAWVVGLELLSFVAVVVAGAVVVARVTETPLSVGGVARYGLFVLATLLVPSVNFSGGSVVVGLALFVPAFYVAVHLFALPALLVHGVGFRSAVRGSWALVTGVGWSVFGLLVALGLCYSLVALVPAVGTVLSTALAGTLHAVVLGLFVERAGTRPDAAVVSTAAANPANASD